MRLVVDGADIEMPDGASVLDATRASGIDVPTLCHDDRLAPTGACRVCLVHIDGAGAVAACVTPAADGMRVQTSRPEVVATARQMLQLMVDRLPATAVDMPTPLAAICRTLRVSGGGPGRGLDRDTSHPYVHYDPNLCISCGLCVRMCDEVQGTFALTMVGRGAETLAAPGPGTWAESACVACGGCVDCCPSGAITGPGSLGAPSSTVRTTCGYCGVGCSLDVNIELGAIDSITPDHSGPVNRGHACVKGRFAFGFAASPDRLTSPLVRRDGELQPASWDDALRFVADRLGRIIATHGPDSVAAISSARATNEENYLMQKLMRTVIGTNNVDNCARICHAPSATGLTAAFGLAGGTNPSDDIEETDCFLVAGANPTDAHPVIGARIKQRVLAGAALVVIDPRSTDLARLADVHLAGRPGSNVAVFNGLARLLLERGWIEEEFLRDRAGGLGELRRVVADYDPRRVASLSGVPAEALAEAARLFGTASYPSIFYGLGVTEHAHGTDGVRTLANLAILKGAVGTGRGGGVNPLRGQNNVQGASDIGALPDLLPGYQPVTDATARQRYERAWGAQVPATPGLRIPEMFDAALDGRIRALYVFGENVVQTDPDAGRVRAALAACDLVISQEIFLSETARLADVVLPGASFLEKDGTFVNFDRRFQRVRPALRPPGQARTDFDIIASVAAALGRDLDCPTPAAAMDECARLTPVFGGVSHDRLDRNGALHWPCRSADDPGEARLYQHRFATADGRAQLAAIGWLPPGEQPSAEYPFVLVTGRRLVHYNAATMTRRTSNLTLAPDETIDIHPDDAARLHIRDGHAVEVTSRRATITVPARVTDDVPPGHLFMAFHFPDKPANALTSWHRDQDTSCPEYKITAVSLHTMDSSH